MSSALRLATAAATLVAALAAAAPALAADPTPRTPIRHIVSLMQENHSFDNYFGTYPGADGVPKNTCQRVDLADPGKGCIKPTWIGGRAVEDLNHSAAAFNAQYDNGKMDGFVSGIAAATGVVQPLVMGHYDDRDLPYYWNVADSYVLFDRFFTSARAGSVTNHMYWVTGGPGDPKADTIPGGGFDKQTTIFDRLQAKGVSWKFYVQNYDPRITFRSKHLGDRGSQVVWVPLLNYPRYIDNPELFKHIVPIEDFYRDVQRGTLPAVSYIVPSGSSEHPPGSIKAGETFVRTMLNALARSREWKSSAFIWTYDDWGGWFDHVKPPQVDAHGYGFRAPALMVSAYARKGFIDHTTMDFTSILKFIEQNWGLKSLTTRDAKANSLMSAFNFKAPPREPVFLTRDRHVKPVPEPHRSPVYIAYTLVSLLTLAVITFAAMRDRRLRRRDLSPESTSVLVEPLETHEEVHR